MKKNLQITSIALALALVATPAFAQVGSTGDVRLDGPVKIDARMNFQAEMHEDRLEKQKEMRAIQNTMIDLKEDRMDIMKENKTELEAKFDAKREEMHALKEKLQSATTQEEKDAIKAEFSSNREEFKAEVKSTRASNRDEIKAKTAEVQSLRHEVFGKIYGAMIERLETLASRISSRIEKVAAEGHDVSLSKESLATAYAEINLAKADFLTLSDLDDKKNKEVAVSMKTHLRLAHQALAKAVSEIKISISSSVSIQ